MEKDKKNVGSFKGFIEDFSLLELFWCFIVKLPGIN